MDNTDASKTAKELLEERGAVYGEPIYNLECAAKLKEVFRYYASTFRPSDKRFPPGDPRAREGMLAHDDAMENLLTKVARIATGRYCKDNYDDILGYASIAEKLHNRQ